MSFGISAVGWTAIAAVTAAGVSAYSSYETGQAQQAAANYQSQVAANNSKIANMNANSAIDEGNQKLQAEREQASQQQGMIRAVMGAGGLDLDSGTPLRNQHGLAQVTALDQATIKSNAARAAWNYRNQGNDFSGQSELDTMRGANDAEAGWLNGFSTMLSGASTYGSKWGK